MSHAIPHRQILRSKKVFSWFYSSICNGGDLFNCYSWDNNLPSCDYLTFIWALFSKIFTQWDFTAQWQEKKLDGVSDYLGLTSFQHFPENEKKTCHSCSSWRFEAGQSSLQNSLVFPMNFWLLKFCKNPLNPQIAQIVSLCYFSQLCG